MAEVLITLGIIGIVAAMTIPTLIQKQQDKANEAAFKKMYSNLTNALNSVIQENGGSSYQCFWDSGSSFAGECSVFWDKIAEKLSVVKYCTGGTAAGCQPEYPLVTHDCSAFNVSANIKASYFLKDGSLILSYNSRFNEFGLFMVDVNGFKKPNKYGYDVFALTLDAKNNNLNQIVIDDRICSIIQAGGKTPRDILSGN